MIRKVKVEDYERVKNLVKQVHNIHVEKRPDMYTNAEPMPLDYFNQIISADNDKMMYVYEENDKIIGLAELSIKESNPIPIIKHRKTLIIEDIVVDSEYRKQGIGKEIYNYILSVATERNVDDLELNVWAFNENAIKFYESLGMTVKNMKMEYSFNSKLSTKMQEVKITTKAE